jgi:hypothetical protein
MSDSEDFVNKWFLRGKIDNKHEFRTELNQLLKSVVEEALDAVKPDEWNDAANYRVAINERNGLHYIIYKTLITKVPGHWSIVQPHRGTLSNVYYNNEGEVFQHIWRKYKKIRTEAEINLNS